MLDQQVKAASPRVYPIDHYLIGENKMTGMIKILDEEDWSHEPALRPEDEIMLRRLHDMLQSTAEDLKSLSSELTKYHQPGVQVKTQPTAFDEDFNEKVHIQETVSAKFHGHKLVDKNKTLALSNPVSRPTLKQKTVIDSTNSKKVHVSAGVQVNIGLPKTTDQETYGKRTTPAEKCDGLQVETIKSFTRNTSVGYKQLTHKFSESKQVTPRKLLTIQEMPSIDIRSQLKEQIVVSLNILPADKTNQPSANRGNTAVIEVKHDVSTSKDVVSQTSGGNILGDQQIFHPSVVKLADRNIVRKFSKLPLCETSVSTSSSTTDVRKKQKNSREKARTIKIISHSPSEQHIKKNKTLYKKDTSKPAPKLRIGSEEWKKKLNSIYGKASSSKKYKLSPKKTNALGNKSLSNNLNQKVTSFNRKKGINVLNNADYVPYSKLTLGGVSISDIEKEISHVDNKGDLPLSPILDKILSSQDNSVLEISNKHNPHSSSKILTTSDENLLKEVLKIDKKVNKTLRKGFNRRSKLDKPHETKISDCEETKDKNNSNGSYVDDFEDEDVVRTDNSLHMSQSSVETNHKESDEVNTERSEGNNSSACEIDVSGESDTNKNDTYNMEDVKKHLRKPCLAFKKSVDVFEFVHLVDTQDIATQSNKITQNISLKETQTSPQALANVESIHNELWNPIVDPRGELENMLKLEKDFIKKLIVEEYGDLIEKNLLKPTTSKVQATDNNAINTSVLPKNTQTSPFHVKSIMTSPAHTKTRTTSPLPHKLSVYRQASPLLFLAQQESGTSKVEESENGDAGISINLSSPRFNLRLPESSRYVLSNLGDCTSVKKLNNKLTTRKSKKSFSKKMLTSTDSSVGVSESETSSLGEINFRTKGHHRRNVNTYNSESSTSSLAYSSSDLYSGQVLPTKSEGEISLGQL